MASLNLSVQGAMDWVGEFHDGLVEEFMVEYKKLPQVCALDESVTVKRHVKEYATALANWVRASDCWGFESERYFGKDGLRVGKERTFILRPQQLPGTAELEAAIVPAPVAPEMVVMAGSV